MFQTFKVTVQSFCYHPEVWIWTLAFPIILSTLLVFMFSSIDEMTELNPFDVAVLEDENYSESNFSDVVDSLSDEGDDHLINVIEVKTKEVGDDLVRNQKVEGLLSVGSDGKPHLTTLSVSKLLGNMHQIYASILSQVCDSYVQNSELVTQIAKDSPMVFANPTKIEEALDQPSYVSDFSLTENTPKETVRFYYALLGMAALMGANVALMSVVSIQPNLSAVAARRAVGSQSRGKMFLAIFLASWLVQFVCMLVAYAFIRFVVGIDFAGKDFYCAIGLLVASLMACAAGAIIGAIPGIPGGSKGGIIAGVTSILALFAGLYGEPSMRLADEISASVPILAKLNPAKVVTDMFYNLYYYDTLGPFWNTVLILIAFSVLFVAISLIFVRKQRYEYV